MADIDELVVKIKADTSSASTSLNALNKKLTDLNSALSGLNVSSLSGLSQGVMQLSSAISVFKASGVNRADFTRIADCLNDLANVNSTSLVGLGNALNKLQNELNNLAMMSAVSKNVTDTVSALGKFGGANITRAISNIPLLTNALMQMFTSLSTAPRVSQNVIQMVNALANLSAQGQRVGSASNSISRAFSGIYSASNRARSGISSLASAFGKFYATYFLVIRGIKKLWQGVESSMDYVETFNYFNVTMQNIGKETAKKFGELGTDAAEEYSNNFINQLKELNQKMTGYAVGSSGELVWADVDNLGLDANQLVNFQARIGAVTNSIGLMGDVSTNTAEAMTMLASDLSSLTNVDLEDVMGNLTSGLIGQSRALYKYGVDITNATLSEYALANGITKKVSAMSQSEKMQLRVLAILDQTEIAYGDQANTINSVANQYRMFKQQIANFGRILGNLVLPVIQTLLPMVNGLIISLSNLFTTLGFKLWGDNWLSGIMDGISGATLGMEDLEGETDLVGDDLDDATKSAKKLKKQLQGFDELNVISDKDDETLQLLTGGVDLSAQIDDALKKYKEKWGKAFENVENNALKFSKSMDVVLKPIGTIMEDFAIGDYFKAGEDVSDLVISITNFLSEAIDRIEWKEIGKSIGEFLDGIKWGEIFMSVGNFLETALNSAVDLLKGMWDADPLSAVIVGALAIAKFTGLNSVISGAITSSIGGGIGIYPKIMILGATAVVGFNFGKWLGKKLFPDDKEYYENFHLFGDEGALKQIWEADLKQLAEALFDVVNNFGITPGQIMAHWFLDKTDGAATPNQIGTNLVIDGLKSFFDKQKKTEQTTWTSNEDLFKNENKTLFDVSNIYSVNTDSKLEDVSDSIYSTSKDQVEELKNISQVLREKARVNVTIDSNAMYNELTNVAWRRFNATGSTGMP